MHQVKFLETCEERNAEIERLWSEVRAIYAELPNTERRHDDAAQTCRRLLMETLSSKLRRMEALTTLNGPRAAPDSEVAQPASSTELPGPR